jgi:DNA (cytosine-5)-methyltransferase 1
VRSTGTLYILERSGGPVTTATIVAVREEPDTATASSVDRVSLKVAGLFAGIGGIEQGLHRAGHVGALLCEIEPTANQVLRSHFPGIALAEDVRQLQSVGDVDLLAAGFPCQDLSQAGRTAGIAGSQSSLVDEVFRLLRSSGEPPRWILFENVPFMLQLDRGQAMAHLVDRLETLGFRWAYRVVDARAFGLPQRRQRVLMLASKVDDPSSVLFADDAGQQPDASDPSAFGFYWTEGTRGLGWAVDAVPTLKGGSTIGIPSPPAIWFPETGMIGSPDIRDAERLQGFDVDWTLPAMEVGRRRVGARWKLVGNAVNVPVSTWLGEKLAIPKPIEVTGRRLEPRSAWPKAAFGGDGVAYEANVSMWPVETPRPRLAEWLEYDVKPLSLRAISGFRSRAEKSSLRFPPRFLDAVRGYEARVRAATPRED